jgi:hypothetical protein
VGEALSEPKTEAECDQFRKTLASGRPVLSTSSKVCGLEGVKRVVFKRDARVHDKHHYIPIFEFGKGAGSPG